MARGCIIYLRTVRREVAVEKYDVFISYRREGGEYLAGRIRDSLVERGYRVFLDVESLRSGRFDDRLLQIIGATPVFVLVCTPHSLDRCVNEGDWVSAELRHALECGRLIVPVITNGFEFPELLPDDIDDVRNMNGPGLYSGYYDEFISRLCGFFGGVRPRRRRVALRLLAAAFLVVAIAGAAFALGPRLSQPPEEPSEEESVVEESAEEGSAADEPATEEAEPEPEPTPAESFPRRWMGTYTGTSSLVDGDHHISRALALDFQTVTEGGRIEGVCYVGTAETGPGETYGTCHVSGTVNWETGAVRFSGTDWIDQGGLGELREYDGILGLAGDTMQGAARDVGTGDHEMPWSVKSVSEIVIWQDGKLTTVQ